MDLLLLKRAGVAALVAVNAVLLAWAVTAYRRKGSLPDGYYRVLPVSVAVAAFQLGMGLYFVLGGRVAHPMHLFYGILVAVGAILQISLRPGTAAGQKYRNRPLVHAVLALFVALVSIRSWMSG